MLFRINELQQYKEMACNGFLKPSIMRDHEGTINHGAGCRAMGMHEAVGTGVV
jgi:hypothetical protein